MLLTVPSQCDLTKITQSLYFDTKTARLLCRRCHVTFSDVRTRQRIVF